MALTRIVVIAAAVQSGTTTFPAAAVPVGTSFITVSVDRALLSDPTIQVSWALELSLTGDAGPWIPWGAARAVGGPVAADPKNPTGESNFFTSLVRRLRDGTIEPGFEPSNANRRIRGSLTLNKPVTTSVAVTLDDAAVPPVVVVPSFHQSVVFDNTSGAFGVSNGTGMTSSAFTITSSANRAGAIGHSGTNNTITGITGDIGGTAGSLVTGTDSTTASSNDRSLIFGVTAPPSGSQTATMNWTGSSNVTMGAVTASGVDQTTPFNNGTFTTGTNPVSVAITSAANDMTFANAAVGSAVLSAATQTEEWNATSAAHGAGSINQGGGTVTHSWTSSQPAETNAISGANFQAVATAAGTPIVSPSVPSRRMLSWTRRAA